ncbi:MAG TPA: FkbM family methyltransferase [Longimicrobiales bacterium]
MKAYVRRLAWLLIRLLPESFIQELRRRRYLRVLKQADAGEPELEVIAALLQPGATCIDIGANFGVYTVALSKMVGAQGRVISIEPMPQTYTMLAKNIAQLGLANTQSLQCAVSDLDGEVTMTVPRWNYGPPNFYEAHITDARDAIGGVTIMSRRLDSIIAQLEADVSFIKCDVEGHELSVLKGAPETLQRGAAWFIEVSGDPDSTTSNASQVIHLMNAAGYQTYRYADGLIAPRIKGDQFINYFFLQSRHVERLRAAGLLEVNISKVAPL